MKTAYRAIRPHHVRSERPHDLSESERRHVFKKVQQNSRARALEIATDIKDSFQETVCSDPVCKILKKGGYRCLVARRSPFISHVNRKRRIDFVKEA